MVAGAWGLRIGVEAWIGIASSDGSGSHTIA